MNLIFLLLLLSNIISGILLLPYPINMFLLAISSTNWKDPEIKEYYTEIELPDVTIQLPVYNEQNVIRRTISNITKINYPRDKLFIQILDDSTDETSSIIDLEVNKFIKEGFCFEIIRRNERTGYKAGALQNGLKHKTAEFIAIFDADFNINPNFLEKTIHHFKNNPQIGAVQTRWDHSNFKYSIFTRSMSIGLDGHFLVEKMGRKKRNAFITFNGTGGIWRRSVIEKSGGWSFQTLAEDFDLAYRAQMKGYEIIYLKDVKNSQEIPPTLRCWIIQQSRWSKGFSQNLRKNYSDFWRNSAGKSRFQGTIHFTQYFVPVLIIVNTCTSSMLLYFPQFKGDIFFIFGLLFSIAAILGIFAYIFAIIRARRPLTNILLIPLFLFWGAGLIVRMGIGTLNGLWKKGGEFVRTPKFGLSDEYEEKKVGIRQKIPLDRILIAELAYIIIIIFGIVKILELGLSYFSQGLYYIFILLSIINLVISEILHAFGTH